MKSRTYILRARL